MPIDLSFQLNSIYLYRDEGKGGKFRNGKKYSNIFFVLQKAFSFFYDSVNKKNTLNPQGQKIIKNEGQHEKKF